MLYRVIIAVCSEIHTKHINLLCGQDVEFLGKIANLPEATINFVMSVRLSVRLSFLTRGATRPPLKGFTCNLIFEYFSKFCLENSSVHKIWQQWRVLYMLTGRPICIYFYNDNCYRRKFRGNQNTHFCVETIFCFENFDFYVIMLKYMVEPDRDADDNMARANCMLGTSGYRHTVRIRNF